MLDARRMEVYCALYDSKLNEVRATSAVIVDEHSFSDVINKQPIIFFGDGAMKCKDTLKHANASFVENIFPSAATLSPLSNQAYTLKQFENLAYFEPFYLKEFMGGK